MALPTRSGNGSTDEEFTPCSALIVRRARRTRLQTALQDFAVQAAVAVVNDAERVRRMVTHDGFPFVMRSTHDGTDASITELAALEVDSRDREGWHSVPPV